MNVPPLSQMTYSNVSQAQRRDVPGIGLGLGPGVHDCGGPANGGFWPGFAFCQTDQSRSISAWCIQKMGSAGVVGTMLIDPPTQTCPELWIPSSACANGLKVPFANAAVTAAALGSVEKAPMLRVTV